MEKIKLQISGSQIEVLARPAVITAGTVGLEAEFVFDSQWDGLVKTVVFRAGDKVIATALPQDAHIVPWEVLGKPDSWLCIGVYGANADGTVVIPTLWAKVAVIHTGVDPEGDPALEPTNPIWQETLARVANMEPQVSDHINNANGKNPHGVTWQQVGAISGPVFDAFRIDIMGNFQEMDYRFYEVDDQIYALDNRLQKTLDTHKADTGNPHGITCEQLGAVSTEQFQTAMGDIATTLDGILAMQNELIGGDGI